MDFEALFLSDFCIEKKPDNLLDFIERAVAVAEFKYRPELEKRRNRIIKCMMNPGKLDYDDDDASTLDDDDEEDGDSVGDEEEDRVGDEEKDEVTNVEEKDSVGDEDEVTNVEEEKQQITVPTNQKPTMKIKLKIKKSVQVAAPLEKRNNCNAMEELKKTDLVDKQLDANKERTRQSHTTTTTTGTRKRNVPTHVAPPPSKKLLSDFSFNKQFDGDKQQSHKGFKKMDNLTGNKSEQRKECTSALTKRMPPPSTKMNVATKGEIVAPTPHQKELLSDCSPKKQSKYSAITRPMQKKTTQSSQVVRPMQKETESIRDDRNMKFESSKRKFEERFAEQREAKRRIMMVDFHDMPNPPNDPCAPRRRCWNRRF